MRGHSDITNLLISQGGNINARTRLQYTPLHLASQEGHLQVVKSLVQSGASWDDRTDQGVAPIHKAAKNNREEVVRYLVTTAGCPVDIVSIYISTSQG